MHRILSVDGDGKPVALENAAIEWGDSSGKLEKVGLYYSAFATISIERRSLIVARFFVDGRRIQCFAWRSIKKAM